MKAEEPITDFNQLDLSKSYTYWEYYHWQFPDRVELIKGKVYKKPPITYANHQLIVGNIIYGVYNAFKKINAEFLPGPFDVRLHIPETLKDATVVQPDFLVVCDPEKLENGLSCDGSPDLMIEIISPESIIHDVRTKFDLYEQAGVREYWLVDMSHKVVYIYTLVNGRYIQAGLFMDDMTVQSQLFSELKVEVKTIFHRLLTFPD